MIAPAGTIPLIYRPKGSQVISISNVVQGGIMMIKLHWDGSVKNLLRDGSNPFNNHVEQSFCYIPNNLI